MKPTSNLVRWALIILAILSAGGVGDFAHPASKALHPRKEPAAIGVNSVCPPGWTQTTGVDPNAQPASGRGTTFYVCSKDKTEITVWSNGKFSGFTPEGRALASDEARSTLLGVSPAPDTSVP